MHFVTRVRAWRVARLHSVQCIVRVIRKGYAVFYEAFHLFIYICRESKSLEYNIV
jgi:hypothetical protein